MANSDLYLIIKGVKGESKDKEFAEEIEILSCSWGVVNQGNFHTGTGGGSNRAQIMDLRVSKELDASGATLAQHCATGEHLKDVTVVRRRAGGKKAATWAEFKIEKCMVSAYMVDLQGTPTERIVLHFQKMTYTVNRQDNTGAQTGATLMTYDAAGHDK